MFGYLIVYLSIIIIVHLRLASLSDEILYQSGAFFPYLILFLAPSFFVWVFALDFWYCLRVDTTYLSRMKDSLFVVYLMICTLLVFVIPIALSPYNAIEIDEEVSLIAGLILVHTFAQSLYFYARHKYMKDFALHEISKRRRGKRSKIRISEVRKRGEEQDIEFLTIILENDVNFRNREIAAQYLGNIGEASSTPFLIDSLLDDEYVVRLAAAISLCKLHNQSGHAVLKKAYLEGEAVERVKVIEAVKLIDADWAVELLQAAKEDEDREVRNAAQ